MPAALWVALAIAVATPPISYYLTLRAERKKAADARRAEVYVSVITFAATWHDMLYRAFEAEGKDQAKVEQIKSRMRTLLTSPEGGGSARFVVHRAQLLAVGSPKVLKAYDEFEEALGPTEPIPFAIATLAIVEGAWQRLVKAIQGELGVKGN